MDWLSVAVAISSAVAGFAAGYGALRALVSELRSNVAHLTGAVNTATLSLQTVVSDARHFGQQLSEQGTTLRELTERLRQVEIDLARLQTH